MEAKKKQSRTSNDELTAHDLVVLSILAEQAMHGYKLNQTLQERDAKDWAVISKPQIYYSLKKLKLRKLIRVDESSTKEGKTGPEGDVFALTKTGLDALKEGLSDTKWATQRHPPPFLTWLAMSVHADAMVRRTMILARKNFLEQELSREKKTLEEFKITNDLMTESGRLMVALTIKNFELELNWLNEVAQKLT